MISVYNVKPKFQNLLRPILGSLVKIGVTPNHLTLLAIAGSIAVELAVGFGYKTPIYLLVFPLGLFLRMALNALDGMAAREYDMASNWAGVL